MNENSLTVTHSVLVEEEIQFTLIELSRACQVDSQQLMALVDEGVLMPRGTHATEWRFEGGALRRARSALRLMQDLELNTAAAALVLDLLDQIDALRSRLRRSALADAPF
jgi:chaperone modulatory protein CbpM